MYKALYDGLFVGESPIAGQGLFTKKELNIDTELGLSHVLMGEEILRTPLGGFINHSENPNCEKYLINNKLNTTNEERRTKKEEQ